MYRYGLIGNCQTAALISDEGSIDWLCLPRPDSAPVFGKILDQSGGNFSIIPVGKFKSKQNYISNTNVLVTIFFCDDGSEFQITDFAPRFEQHGRMYRPMSIFRIVEPIRGAPQIRVACSPVSGWDKKAANPVRGNSHIKYEIRGDTLKVLTNMPLTYFSDGSSFTLNDKIYFGITWGLGIEDDLATVAKQFLVKTISYWRTWVKHCSIPTLYQKETIRSALALKLHCYEDTGAILAALTTSLPEEVGQNRNWDYRYCWLRDSAFVLSAFHNLGHFEEMEGFLKFLFNIGQKYEYSRSRLSPVYSLDQNLPLPETEIQNWSGYLNSKPVRTNNQAAEHIQNDVYGEMILTLAPVFFDERFQHLRTRAHEEILQNLGELAIRNIGKPDAGPWEIRGGWQEHSFSNLMIWAGIDRIINIKELGYLKNFEMDLLEVAKRSCEERIHSAAKNGIVRNGFKDDSLDAALLLLPVLRFPDKDLCKNTILSIYSALQLSDGNNFLYRYTRTDDFGAPKSAFILCSFWLVQALSKVGEIDLAKEIMDKTLEASNSLGLLSEHFIPYEKQQVGNYPQAYSHVGLINAAFSLSPSWSEIL